MNEKEIKECLLNIGVHDEEKPRMVVVNVCEEALDYIVELEAENAKIKQDINKIKADAIREMAFKLCTDGDQKCISTYDEVNKYADKIEKGWGRVKIFFKLILVSAAYYLSICSIYQVIMWDGFTWDMSEWHLLARTAFICGWLMTMTISFMIFHLKADKLGRKC